MDVKISNSVEASGRTWGDTLTPISDPAHDEVRQYAQSLSAEVRQAMTAAQILTAVNEGRRQAHVEKVPLTKNLIGLFFVSHAELSFDQRMSLTSIMAHRGIDLVGLDAGTLRDIFIEKENLMAPSVFGLKMKMMEQKAFWMRTKIFSTSTMNKMIHGSSVASKAEDQEKAKEGDAVERAAAEAAAVGDSFLLADRRKATTRKATVSLMTGRGKLKRPGGGKMAGQVSLTQQTHGSHGTRNQHMSTQKVTSLKVKARKVRKVRRVMMVKTRKAVLM